MLAAQTPPSVSHAGDLRQRDELQLDPEGKFTSFGHYMHAKVSKLMHQVHDEATTKSRIFDGISIYVNGYTDPPALELRKIIVENGGEYHHYYFYGQTTYMVANSLSVSKWNSLRANEKVIRPGWLIQSIKAGELLPESVFLLRKPDSPAEMQTRNCQPPREHPAQNPTRKAAPSVSEFYQRSRLHLISTLAQELKQFVGELRRNSARHFPSRRRLAHLSAAGADDDDLLREHLKKPIICHIDMDCFFVSVALRTRPELRGKPVAITHSKSGDGKKGGYGEIASCSYEARAFGVRSAMLVNRATALCPALICLPYQFDEYRETSKLLYSTIANYTLNIRAVSCDEMYINLTELCSEMRILDPMAAISELRKEIVELTQCNASAGIGSNVLLARLATKRAKPNGQCWIRDAEVAEFMKSISVRDIPGVGYAMEYKLREAFGDELKNCRQIQQISLARLQAVCGEKLGQKLFESCRGICRDELETDMLDANSTRKSVSCDVNFGIRMSTKEELWKFFEDVGAQLASKLEALDVSGASLTLKLMIRAPDAPIEPAKYGAHGVCNNISKTFLFAEPTRSPRALFSAATRLAAQLAPVISDIRGIGLQMTRLSGQLGVNDVVNFATKRREREVGQPSIRDFLSARKTPSPNVCEESTALNAKNGVLPRKLPLAKPPKPPTTASKYSTARKVAPKNVMPRRRARVHRRIMHTLSEAPHFSKDLTSANVELRSGLLLVGSVEIAYREEASKATVEKLLTFFTRLVQEAHFHEVTSFYSFLQRNLYSLQDAHSDWLVVVTELKSKINLTSLQLYDSIVFD